MCFWKKKPDINSKLDFDLRNVVLSLNPRDAITGGRTEVFSYYYKVQDNEEIRYLDFTSLYPYVNKYVPYPIGHPTILKQNDIPSYDDVMKMHGFIKCKILPSQKLDIPVLPVKVNKKLYFPLCRKCSEINHMSPCEHSESERMLIGTWVIPEVALAVENGYKIIEIFEVWKYNIIQYDPKSKEGGLFSEYVNTFLKIKQEASGWPSNCVTEEDKDRFICMYEKQESVILDKSKIQKNSGLRHVSKLCLNSLWGKFAQRDERIQTSVIKTYKELCEFIETPGIELSSIYVIDEDTLWINWRQNQEDLDVLVHGNIPIGAYTTSYARIKLYDVIKKVSKKVLYCDTDSVIFIEKKGENTFNTSNFLGELTNELESYGQEAFIFEFVSLGSKCYSLKIKNNTGFHYVTKCKGITLNSKSSDMINFEKMKQMVHENIDDIQIENKNKIKRKLPGTVVSEPEVKKIRFTYDKRVFQKNGFSVPYGYSK